MVMAAVRAAMTSTRNRPRQRLSPGPSAALQASRETLTTEDMTALVSTPRSLTTSARHPWSPPAMRSRAQRKTSLLQNSTLPLPKALPPAQSQVRTSRCRTLRGCRKRSGPSTIYRDCASRSEATTMLRRLSEVYTSRSDH